MIDAMEYKVGHKVIKFIQHELKQGTWFDVFIKTIKMVDIENDIIQLDDLSCYTLSSGKPKSLISETFIILPTKEQLLIVEQWLKTQELWVKLQNINYSLLDYDLLVKINKTIDDNIIGQKFNNPILPIIDVLKMENDKLDGNIKIKINYHNNNNL